MTITITKEPNKYSFTGNPVVFEALTDSYEPVDVEISTGEETYSTTYYPFRISEDSYKISMNLSDFLHFDNNVEIPQDGIISPIDGFSQEYQVKIGDDYVFNGIALRGGISNEVFRILEENEYDIFTYRLSSLFDQFLFTTRTNGKEIRIKETELFPFVFRHPGKAIVFRTESGDQISASAQVTGTFCVMNIQAVLTQMPADTNRIEIWINEEYVFHFKILPGKLSEEKYLLRFRNSLGAFEILEVTGKALHAPEFAEENLWQTLTELDFYEERRSRVKSKGVIQVETGYKERGEFLFILDLIQSDEIYFIYPDGDSYRCHIKADSAQYYNLMTQPTSVKLKITPTLEETFITPKIESITPAPILNVDPLTLYFDGYGHSLNVHVIIENRPNSEYIIETPSWLTVSNKTQTGFTLTAKENLTEEELNDIVTVQLVDYPKQIQTIQVSQAIEPLTLVYVTTNSTNGYSINLLTQNTTSYIDWGDGTTSNAALFPGTANIGANHTYTSDGDFIITVHNLLDIPTNFINQYNSTVTGVKLFGAINSIGANAFPWLNNLSNIELSPLIKSIGANAFYNCQKVTGDLKFIQLESLGLAAFKNTAITSFEVSGNSTVTSIPNDCFNTCQHLTSVILGDSITAIGNNAFIYTKNSQWKLQFSGKITSIGTSAFYSGGLSGSYVFPDLVSLGDTAFTDCPYLTGLDFRNAQFPRYYMAPPNGLIFTSLYLPATITTVSGNFAFGGVLYDVYLYAPNPPAMAGTIGGGLRNVNVHVPMSSLPLYQADPNWNGTNAPRIILKGFIIKYL